MDHAYFPTIFNIGTKSTNKNIETPTPAKLVQEEPQAPVFLTNGDWDLLLEKSYTRVYQPNEVIMQKGEFPKEMYVIDRGMVRVEHELGKILATHQSGAVFGEMSFLQGSAVSASVIAVDQVSVKILSHMQINGLLISVACLAVRFYQTLAVALAQRLQKTSAQLTQPGY